MARFQRKAKRQRPEKGKGATLEVTVERILPGGLGLAHAEGRTVLVGLAAPGDRVRVEVERERGMVVFAKVKEVIEPSPVRVEPPCPYFGRCGGCDFQQLDYAAQLAAKVEIIRDCLRRIAKIEPPEIHITPSPLEWQYRARAQWQHDALRMRLGYFERGSHNICDVERCPVIAPALEVVLAELRGRMRALELSPEATDFQAVAGDEGVSLAPPLNDGGEVREVSIEIGENRYRFSAEGFFQINQSLLPALVAEATRGAKGETALDLYCGVGLFTLPLARRFTRVTGVEANPEAVSYARRNLAEAGLANAAIECDAVGRWLSACGPTHTSLDLVVLDPPRTGLEDGALSPLLSLGASEITYVSCDPATLARDLGQLLAEDRYTLDRVTAFDMFPQTHHVETIVHLKASG